MLNNKTKDFLYVTSGQIVGMAISIVRSLILPIFMTVSDFGYFQSYLFYISLMPLITIGYNDGVYLRYTKFGYKDFPHNKLYGSHIIFTVSMILLSAFICLLTFFTLENNNLKLIFFLSCSYSVFNGLNALILQIFQITNQFGKYTIFSITSRALSLLLIIFLVLINKLGYLEIILADLLSFIIITIWIIFKHKEMFQFHLNIFQGVQEYIINVKSGFPLLIAGIVGLLYMGGGRIIIQTLGNIEDFSIYSFALSLATFISIAISSISIIIYPMISRYNQDELHNLYTKLSNLINTSLLIFIPSYYILVCGVKIFYEKFTEVIAYLDIVLIMMYIQSFIYILQNTYYKSLRLEKYLLKDNVFSILFLFCIGYPVYYITHNVLYITLITLLALIIRFYISAHRLGKIFNITRKYPWQEMIVIFIFIAVNQLLHNNLMFGLIINMGLCIIYWIGNKAHINNMLKTIRI